MFKITSIVVLMLGAIVAAQSKPAAPAEKQPVEDLGKLLDTVPAELRPAEGTKWEMEHTRKISMWLLENAVGLEIDVPIKVTHVLPVRDDKREVIGEIVPRQFKAMGTTLDGMIVTLRLPKEEKVSLKNGILRVNGGTIRGLSVSMNRDTLDGSIGIDATGVRVGK